MPGPQPCHCRPFIFCIVGRGLDPSAGRRGRRPLQHNPQGFSLPQTSAAAWGQAALHPTLPYSVGRAFVRDPFTAVCRGRACPARSLASAPGFVLHPLYLLHRREGLRGCEQGPRLSGAKPGCEQCLPLRGKQPHERVCAANWRRSLCAAKRPRTPAGINFRPLVGAGHARPAAYRRRPFCG